MLGGFINSDRTYRYLYVHTEHSFKKNILRMYVNTIIIIKLQTDIDFSPRDKSTEQSDNYFKSGKIAYMYRYILI